MEEKKIYTRKGDQGMTSLPSGKRVEKNHSRVEAYGEIDELNSMLGLLGSYLTEDVDKWNITKIQRNLFTIGGSLSRDEAAEGNVLPERSIIELENAIDVMNRVMPALHNFIIPGGSKTGAYCHVTRAVCRRIERHLVGLQHELNIGNDILPYINRLSDFLFVLARKMNFVSNIDELVV